MGRQNLGRFLKALGRHYGLTNIGGRFLSDAELDAGWVERVAIDPVKPRQPTPSRTRVQQAQEARPQAKDRP